MATREAPDLHQKWIPHDRDRTVHSPKVPPDGPDDLWKNSTISVRSNCDHSSWNHLHDHRTTVVGASIPRSTHDRSAIVVLFQVKLKLTHHQIGAELKPGSMPKESLPRPLQIAPTTASIGHDLLAKFPLKTDVFLYCSSTFDRYMKKLSEFRGRSLVHRDPPAFRLDCEAIGAGLITNFSLISSNFPLKFRTSTRKNPSKFASIHEN